MKIRCFKKPEKCNLFRRLFRGNNLNRKKSKEINKLCIFRPHYKIVVFLYNLHLFISMDNAMNDLLSSSSFYA
jgi:hypothetical protein